MSDPTKDPQATKPNGAVSKKHPINKAHLIALALHRAGYGLGHGTLNGVTMPRIIRPYMGNARRTS